MPHPVAFITGVSRGIGKALALELLHSGYQVTGIGRTHQIDHENFSFIELDLLNITAAGEFKFPSKSAEHIVLVNNAGILGNIKPVGSLTAKEIRDVMQINTIAPQQLTNQFIQQFQGKVKKLHVLNISSGAGKRPIDAWATYCASKSALDLFSLTLSEELKARRFNQIYVHSIAPGVVDTAMQAHIRNAHPDDFLASQRFHDLFSQNELLSPELVAQKLKQVIEKPESYSNVMMSLSDI